MAATTAINSRTAAAPAAAPAEVTLRDGRCVALRPVEPGDAVRLVDLHHRCSDDSRYYRFHSPKPRLRPAEAEYLAASDGDARVALVATVVEDGEERIVADARFDAVGSATAEAALLVRDDFQSAGLGRLLLERLVDVAAALGHRRLLLEILGENRRMQRLARGIGARSTGPTGRSMLYAVELAPAAFPGDTPEPPADRR